ncbi:MAG: hypothetical protein M1820_004512 [Bogoriella megaspora]|nr:MAG: hypothetical protein M1820_004512 [Bogoriella megaspora]
MQLLSQQGRSCSTPPDTVYRWLGIIALHVLIIGLTEVDDSPADPTAIIIFIHGLFGHPYETWSAKSAAKNEEQVFWPRDLLREALTDVRIFTWGYDADIDGFFSTGSQNTIRQHANGLLTDVADLIETPDNKRSLPIIFVVHSLGGIIVKDAIIQSVETVGTRLKIVAPVVYGIIFLGTPHRGSNSATLGKIAFSIKQVATKRPNLRLLRGLEPNSETLDRIGSSFSQVLLRQTLELYSYREEKETRKLGLFSTIVVDADSAKIGDGKEETGSIPADHSRLTKFATRDDVGFRRVSAQLRRWTKKISGMSDDTDLQAILDSLDDKLARSRVLDVQPEHKSTFQWLYDPEATTFPNWLRGSNKAPEFGGSIYWIHGKPGSGKSTLMKFALRHADTKSLLPNSGEGNTRWILPAFFFHDRGIGSQKSLQGMMKEILFQLLSEEPRLHYYVLSEWRALLFRQKTQRPEWDKQTLGAALEAIIATCEIPLSVCIFLDALDEHDANASDSNEELISFVESLAEKADASELVNLKICLASRDWNIFKDAFGNCAGLAIHEHTKDDIYTYSRAKLASHLTSSIGSPTSFDSLLRQVTAKASGVFIWVRLVVEDLRRAMRDGADVALLQKLLTETPQELHELYARTLDRIEPDYAAEGNAMLEISFWSVRPLSLRAFIGCAMCASHERPDEVDTSNLGTDDVLLRRLVSRSGGLLEAVNVVNNDQNSHMAKPTSEPGFFVQPIHQTVKDFIRKKTYNYPLEHRGSYYLLSYGCRANSPWVKEIFDDFLAYAQELDLAAPKQRFLIHTAIGDRFISMLDNEIIQIFDDGDLQFATSNEEMWAGPGQLLTPQSKSKKLEEWLERHKPEDICPELIEHLGSDRICDPLGPATIVDYLAVAAGLKSYTFVSSPLDGARFAAAATSSLRLPGVVQRDRIDMIRHLRTIGCDINHRILQGSQGRSALAIALQPGQLPEDERSRVIKGLLQEGAHVRLRDPDPGFPDIYLFHRSTCYYDALAVQILLENGEDCTTEDDRGMTAVDYAILRGDQSILRVFEDHGIELSTRRLLLGISGRAVIEGSEHEGMMAGVFHAGGLVSDLAVRLGRRHIS